MSRQSNRLTMIIAELVADALEVPIKELPPLSKTIDPDALDGLVPQAGGEASGDVAVSFTHADMRIHIHAGNTVYVQPIRDEGRGPVSTGSVV